MFNKRLIEAAPAALKYIRKNVLFQWLSLLCSIASSLILCLMASAFLSHQDMNAASALLCLMILAVLMVLRSFFTGRSLNMAACSAHAVKKQLRSELFEKAAEIGPDYPAYFSSAELTSLSNEGIEQLESYFASYLPQFFYALIAPVTLFVLCAFWDIRSALILLLCVPLIPASIVAVQKFAKKLLSRYWGQYTGLSDSFLENLQGLTTLKIYGTDEARHQKMNEEAENFRKITMRVLIMQLNSISVMDLVAYGGAAAGIISALCSYQAGWLNIWQTLAFIVLSPEFFLPMRLLGSYFHVSMNGSAAADRIFRILDVKVPERKLSWPADGTDCQIHADHLRFAYEKGQDVLKDISFSLPKTGMIGICGESGSGKSTLASLLCGVLRDEDHALLAGNVPFSEMDPVSVLSEVTVLSFESVLFSGTVRDNLKAADQNASDQQLIQALEQAGIWKELQNMKGLDTRISEKGSSLSGGQRQRIAFARALLKNSPVLILDEACSSVDPVSESIMIESAQKAAKNRLVIFISHRLSSLKNADEILVLKNGKIVQSGSFSELRTAEGEFGRMLSEQMALEAYSVQTSSDQESESADSSAPAKKDHKDSFNNRKEYSV